MLRKFFCNEDGATAIEYAVIAGVISLGLIVAASGLQGDLKDEFGDIGANVSDFHTTGP